MIESPLLRERHALAAFHFVYARLLWALAMPCRAHRASAWLRVSSVSHLRYYLATGNTPGFESWYKYVRSASLDIVYTYTIASRMRLHVFFEHAAKPGPFDA